MMTRPQFSLALLLAVVLTVPAQLTAADAPTQERWAPVVAAVQADAADARTQLASITNEFPAWADGWIEAARYELAKGDAKQAWAFSYKALSIERKQADAAAIAIQALSRLGRPLKDINLVAQHVVGKPQYDRLADGRLGWVGYYAAQAAFDAKDYEAAAEYSKQAKICAGTAIPGEFHLVDARLAKQAGDLAKAEVTLERAVAANAQLYDAWYELGRVRSLLAEGERSEAGKRARLQAAITAFATCTKALPQDRESWYGQAVAHLGLARLAMLAGSEGNGALMETVSAARRAVADNDGYGVAWAVLGEASLRLERWDDAVTALEKARANGADEAGVRSNLAIALQKSGRVQEALALAASGGNQQAADLLAHGLSALQAGNPALATASLRAAADHPDLANDPVVRGQVLRYLGHAWKTYAAEEDLINREARLDAAATAYLEAGDAGDHPARRAYAALQASREPALAYAAGWQTRRWYGSFSGSAWQLILGNYGASRAWDNLLHLTIWGVLVFLPLLLWIKSLFRGGIPAEEARGPRPPAQRPAAAPPTTKPPSDARSREQGSSSVIPQSMAKSREVSALTSRKARERSTTEETPAPKKPAAPPRRRGPLPETEEIPRPDGT